MPRQEIDYFKTVIYKIVSLDLGIKDCYVGSTTDFRKRKSQHKVHCKTLNFKLYQFINSNGGWDNWDMIEIEKYPCIDSNEARTRERYWVEELKAELNTRRPISTTKEDKIKNNMRIRDKEKKKIYDIEYRKKNEEKIKTYQKNYWEKNRHVI
jgi:hypothetical protein